MTANLARTTVRGTFWTYAGYYGGKLMAFLSTLVLIRLLTKDDFGVVGYATTILGFIDVFREMGIGPALIFHHDESDMADTAFWLVLFTASVMCVLTWAVLAPLAGAYFNDPRAVPVTMALVLTYPIIALGTIHENLLSKNLKFSLRFLPDFTYSFSKSGLSILFALLGWGPWSLVLGQIAASVIQVVTDWIILPWRPHFRFAVSKARTLLSYGLNTVLVNAIGMLALNIDYLLVGRFLGAEVLGVYLIAFRIPELLILQFCYIIAKVIFPVYATLRHDPDALRQGFLETLRYVPLITIPMGLGLTLVAPAFVRTFFPANWGDAIPVVQAIAMYAVMLSLSYNAGDVYKAQGRPGLLTWLTAFRLVLLAPALWYVIVRFGTISAVGWVQTGVAFLGGALNLFIASRMLQTPFRSVVRALLPSVIAGAVMSLAVHGTLTLLASPPPLVQLTAGMVVGVLIYVGTLFVIQPRLVREGLQTLRGAWQRK